MPILDGDIGLIWAGSDSGSTGSSAGAKPLTDAGDCGVLFLDKRGIPWYMHHVLAGTVDAPVTYKSFGVPLRAVMASHPGYFGESFIPSGLTASHQVGKLGSLTANNLNDAVRVSL